MIVVRSILKGKFGTGGQLAAANVAAMQQMSGSNMLPGFHTWRVLSDRSGAFDTVTLEATVENIAAWEAARDAMFSHPDFQTAMATTYDLVQGGSSEYLFIEGEGKAGS